MFKQFTIIASATLMLAGCGGGSSDPIVVTPPTTQQSSAGFWNGTTSRGQLVSGVVLNNGVFWFLYTDASASTITGFINGNSNVSGSTFTSSNATDFYLSGATIAPATIAGVAQTQQSLNGTLSYTGQSSSVKFNTTYDPKYTITPSLSTVAGSYSGSVSVPGSTQSTTLNISGNGTIFMSGACAITGTIGIGATSGNTYNVQLSFGAAPCAYPNKIVNGIGLYDATSKHLYIAATDSNNASPYLFVGTHS